LAIKIPISGYVYKEKINIFLIALLIFNNIKIIMTTVSNWMSWEGGIDLAAITSADLQMPNLIVHLGPKVNTPVGNAPGGMILWQPDPNAMPGVMGFISTN
jgi:hypothetical protein